MSKNKTINQKLHSKKIKRPPYIIYDILGIIWKMVFAKKYGLHVEYKCDFRKAKGPYIVISNHASRLDYIFTGVPLLPNNLNYVAGYNEFFRSHLKMVFGLLNVIPKKNFTADIYTIKSVKRVLDQKGKIMLFPEGMNSISGANQPVAIGTGKFIKHFNVPVYYSVIKGGYLTTPKYNLTERCGRVEVVFDRLFTPNEIEKLTPEEIEDKINKAIYHDDYAWNKEHKYVYKNDGKIAEDLENLLYWCPKCGKEFTMKTEKNKIYCEHCGNGATIDDTYEMHPLNDSCVIPETQTVWFNMQRNNIKQEIQNDNFEITEEVELGMLPDYEPLKDLKTSNIVGSGTIKFDKTGFTYNGTKNDELWSFHIDTKDLPTYGMCTDLSRFYTFYQGEFVEFYPKHKTVEKWFLVTEEMHRLNGGRWKDFHFDKDVK